MRPRPVLALLSAGILLASCTTRSILYYDNVFEAAAPSLLREWKRLPVWDGARVVNISPATVEGLDRALSLSPAPAVVALVLDPAARDQVIKSFPKKTFLFIGGIGGASATVRVSTSEAWALVARAAARRDQSPAWVLFPSSATESQKNSFASSWRGAGGGTLQILTWPAPLSDLSAYRQGFDWAGAVADTALLQAAPRGTIHGLPPVSGTGFQPGVTWEVSAQKAAKQIYEASLSGNSTGFFLPLETRPLSR